MSRTPAQIVDAVEFNLMDASASSEVAARVVEFLARAQVELEDTKFSPAQYAVQIFATTNGFTALGVRPADWIGVRIDADESPIVAPHYLTGAGDVVYLQAPFFTDDLTHARAKYGYVGSGTGVGAPQLLVDDAGAFYVYPIPDLGNSIGAFSIAGEYSVRVPYWKRLTAFDGTTANWFTLNCDYYLEWSATAHGLIANRDLSAAATYVSAAAGELERLRSVARESRSPRVVTVRSRGYAIGTQAARTRRIRGDL